jgi:RNA polymerase sigma-70 factor (ECF subfamily)
MAKIPRDSAPHESSEPLLDTITVIQAQAGDEEAFNRLYLLYFRPISLFLIYLVGDEEVGPELAQETFLRAWRSLSRLRQAGAFLGWLYQIARNIAFDDQRRSKHTCSVSLAPEHECIEDKGYARTEEQVIAADQLRCALAAVSREYRAPLVLYHIRGMSTARIAELLDLQESSVRTYISKGMQELRAYLLQSDPTFGKERDQ